MTSGKEALADAVRRAAERARQLATAAEPDGPLLAALREWGSATSSELTGTLKISVGDVRDGLRTLVADGLVHRSGHARSTRYHA